MINFFKNNLLWTEGRRDLMISLMLIGITAFLSNLLLLVTSSFFAFLLFFYRNPTRKLQDLHMQDEVANYDSLILSPADGKIISIEQSEEALRVSIFLSPFNVHVNWVPINGVIKSVKHKPGKFLMAFKSESGELNERNDVLITNRCGSVLTRQIAGLLARRIACWFPLGRNVFLNEKYGMIKFGSRVDIFLPIDAILKVRVGQKVKGGITILGKFTGAPEKC